MRYLGLDLGTKTLGVSISDTTFTIANTLTIIRFKDSDYDSLYPELKKIIEEYNIVKIILGFPKNMNNKIEVIMKDERLSTVEATNYLLEADMSRKKRKKKIDALAANIILQTYLDRRKD